MCPGAYRRGGISRSWKVNLTLGNVQRKGRENSSVRLPVCTAPVYERRYTSTTDLKAQKHLRQVAKTHRRSMRKILGPRAIIGKQLLLGRQVLRQRAMPIRSPRKAVLAIEG